METDKMKEWGQRGGIEAGSVRMASMVCPVGSEGTSSVVCVGDDNVELSRSQDTPTGSQAL